MSRFYTDSFQESISNENVYFRPDRIIKGTREFFYFSLKYFCRYLRYFVGALASKYDLGSFINSRRNATLKSSGLTSSMKISYLG